MGLDSFGIRWAAAYELSELHMECTKVAGTFHVPWLEADGTWNVPATMELVVFILPLVLLPSIFRLNDCQC